MCAQRTESESRVGDAIMDPSSSQIVATAIACGTFRSEARRLRAEQRELNLGLSLKINAMNTGGSNVCRLFDRIATA